MIKAIIFDIGNVIYKFDNKKFIEKISEHSKKSSDELYDLIYKTELVKKYESGKITSQEFYTTAKKICAIEISEEKFREAYTNIFTPITKTFDLIKKLKNDKNYKLALLSNTSEWDYEIAIEPFIKDLFEKAILSYKVKSIKPEKEIYIQALSELNFKAEECIFIDDLEKNLEPAKRLGLSTILYKNHENLIKELKFLNIEVE